MPAIVAAGTEELAGVLITLAIVFVAAKIAAEISERIGQPAVAGEILAGVLLGPAVFAVVLPNEGLTLLAELGVVFLLFSIGLETPVRDLLRVGRRALLVAALGVALPFAAGYGIYLASGANQIESLFVGTALVATSVGITARVLGQMGVLDSPAARVILAAAVIDDVLAVLSLAVVSSLAQEGIDVAGLATQIGLTAIFVLVAVGLGLLAPPVLQRFTSFLRIGNTRFVLGVALCLAMAATAAVIGIAAIIGAFFAGMVLAGLGGETEQHALHVRFQGVTELLVPFFLVNIGLQVSISAFGNLAVILLLVVLTLAAIATKLIGCGLGTFQLGQPIRPQLRLAGQVGMGMVPRGEVGIVVAQVGSSLAIIGAQTYSIVVAMAVLTTLAAPPFLRIFFAGEPRGVERRLPLPEID